jgi:uncharacterized protein YlxW (UPF0749 family)
MENFREKRLERQLKSQQTTGIVLGVVLLLSILGNIYLIVRNSRISDEADLARQESNELVAETETLEIRNQQLQSDIRSLNEQMEQLRETTAALEGELQTRDRRIAQLRRQFPEIEQALEDQTAEFDALEQEYRMLEEERQQLLTKLESLDQELSGLRGEYEALTALVDKATYLQAYNISVVNLRDRWLWGRPVIMDNASRVTRTIVSFEINSNILVDPAQKDVHLVMINPNGEVINPSNSNFTIAGTGEASSYTEHTTIDYDQQSVRQEFTIDHEDGLTSGTHIIEVYIDGDFAGSKEFELE